MEWPLLLAGGFLFDPVKRAFSGDQTILLWEHPVFGKSISQICENTVQ
ncbi:hypothetical protein [Chryseobacterium sp.]|nr:hypothetical protein [Chryseobacterium sp.]